MTEQIRQDYEAWLEVNEHREGYIHFKPVAWWDYVGFLMESEIDDVWDDESMGSIKKMAKLYKKVMNEYNNK